MACWNGHYDVVQELIEAKCKINVKTEDGMGPLHLAAVKGFDEIIRALLEAGVAPDMQDKVISMYIVHLGWGGGVTTHFTLYTVI